MRPAYNLLINLQNISKNLSVLIYYKAQHDIISIKRCEIDGVFFRGNNDPVGLTWDLHWETPGQTYYGLSNFSLSHGVIYGVGMHWVMFFQLGVFGKGFLN